MESIFTIPGLGRQFVSSIANRDYTLILGLTIFMGGSRDPDSAGSGLT